MALQFCSWKWDCTTRDKAQLSEQWNSSILCSNMEKGTKPKSKVKALLLWQQADCENTGKKQLSYLSQAKGTYLEMLGKLHQSLLNGHRDSWPKRVEKNIWVLRKHLWKLWGKKFSVHIPKTKQAACSLYPGTLSKASHLGNKAEHSQ